MPRKQNGFGSFANSGFKGVNSNVKSGKGSSALGRYPSERKFGSTVQRSVIEQYNVDSTWARWRKGMEYYFQGAYLEFLETNAVLYQGTEFEIPVSFDGYRFATKNADSRTHYAVRRTMDQNRQLGFVEEIESNQTAYPTQYKNREVWVKVIAGRDIFSDDVVLRSIGERLTDGTTAANVVNVTTVDKKPALYMGKSPKTGTQVITQIPLDEIRDSEFIRDNNGNLQTLVGQAVYMRDFEILRSISLFDVFTDLKEYMTVEVAEFVGGVPLQILESAGTLPPLLNEINDLPSIFKTDEAVGSLNGAFVFKKDSYQSLWGQQYLTADLMRSQVDRLSYAIQPWIIQSISVNEDLNQLVLTSEPFQASLRLFTPRAQERYIVFADNSFTREEDDYDANGNYNHEPLLPGEKPWRKLDLDVDPWQDQTFITGKPLTFADLYTCSCPSHLRAIIRNPEVYDDQGGKLNRQVRAPFPTAKGVNDFDIAGVGRAAGIAQTWSTMSYRKGFKLCKHSIASMFINKIRVQEPNTFPTAEARENFEAKLAADIREVADEFTAQLKRSEITTVEIVYALAEALNLDDVELGYVLLTSNF